MSESSWQRARLIPTSGINGADEQERRGTSALLAVIASVRDFGRAVTQPLGAPAGTTETFIEVPFVLGDRKCFPDGLIRVRRGRRTWTALVEVRTGSTGLDAAQLENYLDVAHEQGFDAVLTISNEVGGAGGRHPVAVDQRKLRTVGLHHWSWSHLLAEAVTQKAGRGGADPDQAWLLGELVRYLEHPRSGALEFDDMGPAWERVRAAGAEGTLRPGDPGVLDVATRFEALLRFAGLRLGRRLGAEVVPLVTRREAADPMLRTGALSERLVTDGVLTGAIRVPGSQGPTVVTADLRAGTVACHRGSEAGAPDRIGLDRIVLDRPMGMTRGRGRGSFIDSVLEAIDAFQAGRTSGKQPEAGETSTGESSTGEPSTDETRAGEGRSDEKEIEMMIDDETPADTTRGRLRPGRDRATLPDPREPVLEVDLRDLPGSGRPRHPALPSRREVRLVRRLGSDTEEATDSEAGWYQDPQDTAQLRWWDGGGWSERTYPAQPALA